MEEKKKVIVKSKFDNKINNIQNELKGMRNRLNGYGRRLELFEAHTEKGFLEKNKEKEIVLLLSTGKEEKGILDDIDKYRIAINKNGKNYFYYKHAVIGYYLS